MTNDSSDESFRGNKRSRSTSRFPEISREEYLRRRTEKISNDVSWIKDDIGSNSAEIRRLQDENVLLQRQVDTYEREIGELRAELETLK